MKNLIRFFIPMLALLTFVETTAVLGASAEMPTAFNDEYLILLDTPVSASSLHESRNLTAFANRKKAILAGVPGEFTVSRQLSHLPMTVLQTKSAAVLEALKRRSGVVAIYPNRKIYHQLTESLPLIRQEFPTANGYGGHGTAMAIIDTGIDFLNRAEFGNCVGVAAPASCRVLNSVDIATDDGSYDDNGHGTHVAAIAAAVAPDADLVAVDVFNGSSSSDALVIAGLNWAIAHQEDYNIVVINLSLGDGTRNVSLCDNQLTNPYVTPVANARAAGIMVVAAAGNEGYGDGLSRPACTPDIVSVGAVYDANVGGLRYSSCTDYTTAANQATCFSNSASYMSIWAPGALITAVGVMRAGTSQATPHVSGVIAALRSAYPNETLARTTERLLSSGTSVTDPRNGVSLPRLDMEDALDIPEASTIPGMGPEEAVILAAALGLLSGRGRKRPPDN